MLISHAGNKTLYRKGIHAVVSKIIYPAFDNFFCWIVKVNTRIKPMRLYHRTFAEMKKFIAVFLLMVYGFTSIGASVTLHQCSTKQSASAHHHKDWASHHNSSSCSHQQFHFTENGCSGNENVCAVKNEDNLSEQVFSKPLNSQPAIVSLSVNGSRAMRSLFPTSVLRQDHTSSALHKIRLHLYNRILLI
ncbi:hypothetical protein HRH25_23405 [Flavisolibacter sp. BT320]|nr:hypothetical protein [Flavisolibacter longurius]